MKRFAHTSKHHATIKIKPSDVTQGYWLSCWTEHNDKDLKFKIGDHVRTSKKKKKKMFSTKDYTLKLKFGPRRSYWLRK